MVELKPTGTTGRPARGGLFGWVVEEIGQALVDGRVQPGESLASDAIEETYGVSRSVAREALRALEGKGMVSARQNVGTVATPAALWNLLDVDLIRWRVRSRDIANQMRQLIGLREAIEPYAAGQAALGATAEQRDGLAGLAAEMRDAVEAEDMDRFANVDMRMHTAIVEAAGNPMLTQLLGVIGQGLEARREFLWPDRLHQEAIDGHLQLVDCIATGDKAGAEFEARALIAEARSAIEAEMQRKTYPA